MDIWPDLSPSPELSAPAPPSGENPEISRPAVGDQMEIRHG